MLNRNDLICCPWCEQPHCAVALRAGERALCVRCGKTLAGGSFLGPQAPFAFAIAAFALAVPAVVLPFVTLSKFGSARASRLFDAASGLWEAGMHPLAAVVLFCGAIAPVLLLAILLASLRSDAGSSGRGGWAKLLHALQPWAM